ncbi:hypothetical protein T265_13829, partial [Opisthorchis viverrini]
QRSAVSQWIKNKIKNEGIQARNIIKYNVPIENVHGARQSSTTQSSPAKLRMTVTPNRPKPQFVEGTYHTSSWSQLTSPRCNRTLTNSTSATSPSPSLQDRATFSPNSSSTSLQDSSFHKAISNRSMARPPVGSRNAVTARTENEYRARYWGQMLDTLRRTIDEIYSACEADESEVECKEVIMILEHSKQDFRSLIEKMNLLRQYERADDEHRPNALAWDERTTLPGKPIMRQVLASAALAVANVDDSPYISIPLVNFTAGSDLAEASGETESDHLGPGQGLASWHLVVPKHCAKVQRLITDPTQQLTFTTLSNAATPTNRSLPPGLTPSTKYPPSIRSESEMTRSGYSSAKDALFDYTGDDDDLLGSHEDVEFEMDGAEGEDEAEVVDGLSVTNLSADREPDLGNATSSCCFSEGLPEDLDDEDEGDDTTLSRDLRQLDEVIISILPFLWFRSLPAIANVTTAERVLTDQLGRAQCAEAALRRRLLARDETDVDKEYSRSGSFLPSKLTASNKPAGSDLLVLRMGKLAVPRRKPAPISGRVTDPSSGDDRADHDACSRQSVSLRVNCSTPATISSTTLVSSTNLRTVATFTDADHEVHWCGCHCHSRSAGDEANRVPIISSPHFSWSRKADGSSDVIAPEVAHPCGSEREMRISPASASFGNLFAIANVTTAERVLTDQLGRAQCAEAALRRRLLARDETDVDKEYSRSGSFLPSKLTASNKPAGSDLLVLRMGKLAVPRRKPAPISGRVTDPSSGDDRADHDACSRQSVSLRVNCSTPATISSTTLVSSTNLRTVATFTDADHEVHWCGCHCHSRSAGDEANRVPIISSPHFSWSRKADGSSDVIAPEVAHPCGSEREMRISPASASRTTNSMQELEQKQTRARILRQQHLLERSERVHELSKKVEEVHMHKRLLLHQRRSCLERRLHAAERKRKAELERRISKAHDEETKGREIAFIQTLEAEQKQHSILTKHEESRARLDELAAERRRRLEEKLGREEAAKTLEAEQKQHSILTKHEESRARLDELAAERRRRLEEKLGREEAAKGRRRALEASRRARLDALQARWEIRAQQLASRAEYLEHCRRAAAKAKEQHREVKMANLEEQQRTHIEQLRTKIQRKQEESERRHQESLREISRKAFEMSVLTHTGEESFAAAGIEPYPIQKWCRACQVKIVSEVSLKSHLHGKRHQKAFLEANENRPIDRSELEAFNLLHLVDAPSELLDPQAAAEQERLRIRRRRARKLRQRMNQSFNRCVFPNLSLRFFYLSRAAQFSKELEQLKSTIPESPNRSQIQKLVKEARRFVSLPDSGPWVTTRVQAMEKTLNAFLRCLSVTPKDKLLPQSTPVNGSVRFGTAASVDQIVCTHLGLLPVLTSLLSLMCSQRPSGTQLVPDRTYQLAAEVLRAVCQSCSEACRRMVCGNDVAVLVDCLVARFSPPVTSSRQLGTMVTKDDPLDGDSSYTVAVNPCTLAVMHSFTCIINQVVEDWYSNPPIAATSSVDIQRIQDLLGYIVSSGLVDLLAARLSSPRQANWLLRIGSPGKNGPNQFIEQSQQITLATIALLTCLVRLLGCIPSACPTKARSTQTVHTATHQQSEVSSTTGSSVVHVSAVQLSVDETSTYSVSSASRATDASTPPTSSSPRGNNVCVRGTSASSRDTVMGSSTCSYQATTADSTTPITADSTKLLETVIDTEMFGLIPLLYGLLLDPSSRPTQPGMMDTSGGKNEQRKVSGKPTTPGSARSADRKSKLGSSADTKTSAEQSAFRNPAVGQIALQALRLINSFAMVNRPALQTIVSGELTSLLIRHILLALLTRCLCESSSNTVNVPSGLEVDAKVPRKRKVTAESKLSASTTPSRRRVDDTEDLRELIPSGARAAVARAASNTAKSGIDLYGLPDWANENVTPESQPSTVKPVTNLDHMLPSQQLTDAVLHEAILCAGHVCALNFDNQTSLQTGPPPTLLQRLVALPFDYFSQRPLTDILYPTLIAFCYEHPTNSAVLEAELSPTLLANYIEERLLERTMDALSDTDTRILASSEATDPGKRLASALASDGHSTNRPGDGMGLTLIPVELIDKKVFTEK